MKKWICLLLAVLMVSIGLTGCGMDIGTEPDSQTAADVHTGLYPPVSKRHIKIGVLYANTPSAYTGYTDLHELGVQEMQQNFGLSDDQIIRKNSIQDNDAEAIEQALEDLVQQGCQIIFATSSGYTACVERMAAAYPEVIFCQCAGKTSNGSNLTTYFGNINDARYLSGMAAGLKTQTGKIGYVAAQDTQNGEVTSGVDAFALGVAAVNASARVYVQVTGAWNDPAGERQAAVDLLIQGCDVLAQHCDSINPAMVAQNAGIYAIGYPTDLAQQAPDAVLTSVQWDWSIYYTKAVQDVIDGTWMGENYFGGLKDGLVMLSPCSALCAEGTQARIDEVRERILSGEWSVFDGKTAYQTNTGSTETLQAARYEECHWYTWNVEKMGNIG